MMEDELANTVRINKEWSRNEPSIRRVFIYGSRAQGNPRQDSDLDVGVEIEPTGQDESALAIFIQESDRWKEELQPLIPWPLHFELNDARAGTPTIAHGKEEGHIIIYEQDA